MRPCSEASAGGTGSSNPRDREATLEVSELIAVLSKMDRTAKVFVEVNTWPLRILQVKQTSGKVGPRGPVVREVSIIAQDF